MPTSLLLPPTTVPNPYGVVCFYQSAYSLRKEKIMSAKAMPSYKVGTETNQRKKCEYI